MTNFESPSVAKVNEALKAAEIDAAIVELNKNTETIVEAAVELDVEPGAIVQTKVYMVGRRFVLTFIAGDQACQPENIGPALSLRGDVRDPRFEYVRAVTGFPKGGVSPVGLNYTLPTVLDQSLKRFETIYVSAGQPRCLLPLTFDELKKLTGGIVSYNLAKPVPGLEGLNIGKKTVLETAPGSVKESNSETN